jgi:hypothetical protein
MGKYSSIINNIKKAHGLVMMTATPFSSLIPINDISFALNFDIILNSPGTNPFFHVIKYDNESIGNKGDKMITFQQSKKIEYIFDKEKGEDKLYALCYFLSKYLLLRGKKKKENSKASEIDCTTVIPDQHGIESHLGIYEILLMTNKCTKEIKKSMDTNRHRKYVVYIENKICIHFFIFLWCKEYGIESCIGIITGDSNQIQQDVLQKSFVDSQSVLRILIISKAGEAGIDLYYKDVELHILQIPWTYISEKQVQGRVNRCTETEEQELLQKQFAANEMTSILEFYKDFYKKIPYREIIYYYAKFKNDQYLIKKNFQTTVHNKIFKITKKEDLKSQPNEITPSKSEITKDNITDIILWSLLDPMEQYNEPQSTIEEFAKKYLKNVFLWSDIG